MLTAYNNTAVPSWTYRAAMAYVTGSHAVKFGFNRTHGSLDENNYTLNPVSYRFAGGFPNQITQRALVRSITNLDNDLGLYVQDRWTVNRWTIQGALRFDYFATSFPEQTVGPTTLAPNRNITFPAADNISWRDLTYRSGFAYDIFGTGKTALKVSFNKYLLGQTLNGLGRDPNPTLAMTTTANRPWNDRGGLGINGDFIPQCDLANLQPNGECGLIDNLTFGSAVPAAVFDKDLISGFNHRQTNWEMSAGVQHELMPRVALDVGYFRRAWAHFRVTDNLLTAPADFTQFSIVAPDRPAPAGRRRIHTGRVLQRGAGQGRAGQQPEHALGQVRRPDRELERRGRHGEHAAPERADVSGWPQQRQDDGGQLRDSGGAARDEQPGG